MKNIQDTTILTIILRLRKSSTMFEALIVNIDRPIVSRKVWYREIVDESTGAVVSYRMFLVSSNSKQVFSQAVSDNR